MRGGRHGIAGFSRAGSFQANADPTTPRRARHVGNNKHPKGQRELEPWHVAGSTLATQLRRHRDLQSNTQRERFFARHCGLVAETNQRGDV